MKLKSRGDLILGTWFLFLSLNLLIENVKCDLSNPLILTRYVDSGDFETAKRLSEVNSSKFLDVKSYAGFITVDKELDSNMWFWYFPVQDGPTEDAPLVIWLSGHLDLHPLFDTFQGVGPFLYENETLKTNPYSWHMRHSVLFIETPLTREFNFAADQEAYHTNHTQMAANIYQLLQQFYQIFPELQPVPMFLSGESYGGIYISYLANEIHNRNPTEKNKINLKGITIGNGWIDAPNLYQMSSVAYHAGLIDTQQEIELKTVEDKVESAIEQGNWSMAFEWHFQARLYLATVGGPGLFNNYVDGGLYKGYPPYVKFIKSEDILDALHVGNIIDGRLKIAEFAYLLNENMKSAKPIVEILLEHYPIMVYNGQLSLRIPCVNLEKVYNSLSWTGAEKFRQTKRKLWYNEEKVAGYEKRFGNLHQVTYRNVGLGVAVEKPNLLTEKITEFIRTHSQTNETAHVDDKKKIS